MFICQMPIKKVTSIFLYLGLKVVDLMCYCKTESDTFEAGAKLEQREPECTPQYIYEKKNLSNICQGT